MRRPDTSRLEVFANTADLAKALADLFINEARAAIAERGGFYVALAGGTTPKAAYELLAQPPLRDEISWDDVFIYFGDERCVPPDDVLSNYRTAKEAFLDAVPLPGDNIHRMRGELPPDEAAREYATILRSDCGTPPRLDLVMLGLGKDAHTASLFPGEDPLTDNDADVRHTYSKETLTDRISITPRVINNARTVVIATAGADKAEALATVRSRDYNPTAYPVQIVSPKDGTLIWLVDVLAAGMLK